MGSGRSAAIVAAAVMLTACAVAPTRPPASGAPAPPAPTSWTLRHSVAPSGRVHLTGVSISGYAEVSRVAVDTADGSPDDNCSVSVDLTGTGGADDRVGEKVPIEVGGRPGVRGGTGAEGPYLAWRDRRQRWVSVDCQQARTLEVVADRVRLDETSRVAIPVGLSVPAGYQVSSVAVDDQPLRVRILLDRIGGAEGSLQVGLDPDRTEPPPGSPTVVAGRPALRSDLGTAPSVCVQAARGSGYVCVEVPPDDTGPLPDRSRDLPVIDSLAGSLRFADLDDRSTWFALGRAFR